MFEALEDATVSLLFKIYLLFEILPDALFSGFLSPSSGHDLLFLSTSGMCAIVYFPNYPRDSSSDSDTIDKLHALRSIALYELNLGLQ